MVCAGVTRELRLVTIHISDGYIQVPPQRIQHREDLGVTETFDANVHMRDRVSVRYRCCIQTAEVDAERALFHPSWEPTALNLPTTIVQVRSLQPRAGMRSARGSANSSQVLLDTAAAGSKPYQASTGYGA